MDQWNWIANLSELKRCRKKFYEILLDVYTFFLYIYDLMTEISGILKYFKHKVLWTSMSKLINDLRPIFYQAFLLRFPVGPIGRFAGLDHLYKSIRCQFEDWMVYWATLLLNEPFFLSNHQRLPPFFTLFSYTPYITSFRWFVPPKKYM